MHLARLRIVLLLPLLAGGQYDVGDGAAVLLQVHNLVPLYCCQVVALLLILLRRRVLRLMRWVTCNLLVQCNAIARVSLGARMFGCLDDNLLAVVVRINAQDSSSVASNRSSESNRLLATLAGLLHGNSAQRLRRLHIRVFDLVNELREAVLRILGIAISLQQRRSQSAVGGSGHATAER